MEKKIEEKDVKEALSILDDERVLYTLKWQELAPGPKGRLVETDKSFTSIPMEVAALMVSLIVDGRVGMNKMKIEIDTSDKEFDNLIFHSMDLFKNANGWDGMHRLVIKMFALVLMYENTKLHLHNTVMEMGRDEVYHMFDADNLKHISEYFPQDLKVPADRFCTLPMFQDLMITFARSMQRDAEIVSRPIDKKERRTFDD